MFACLVRYVAGVVLLFKGCRVLIQFYIWHVSIILLSQGGSVGLSFLKRKRRLEVDAGALEAGEREGLSGSLRSSLKASIVMNGGKILIESDVLSVDELKRLVTKFVYHRNLNRLYWVGSDGDVVRVHKFDKAKKQEKSKRNATPPHLVTHGW